MATLNLTRTAGQGGQMSVCPGGGQADNPDTPIGVVSGCPSDLAHRDASRVVLGFDPGLSGAVAVVTPSGDLVTACDLPIMGEGKAARIDAASLARLIGEFVPAKAVVEQVGSMPGQGVASTFAFGRAVGVLAGVLGALAVPTVYVAPGTWKRFHGLPSAKEDARRKAIELWPAHASLFARKKDHGRAEAALIARWGADRK